MFSFLFLCPCGVTRGQEEGSLSFSCGKAPGVGWIPGWSRGTPWMLPGGAGNPLEQGKQIPESNPKASAAWEDGLGSPIPRGKLGRHWAAWEGLGRAGNPLEQGKQIPEGNPKAAAAWGAGLGSQLPILGVMGTLGALGSPGGWQVPVPRGASLPLLPGNRWRCCSCLGLLQMWPHLAGRRGAPLPQPVPAPVTHLGLS